MTVESLKICEKCGNVMANRILRRDINGNSGKLERILQCIVCRHWVSLE
ncbi:MAG: hypothetical protein ACFE9R_07865 [Candidatus Hermodarchaeota archaeon]